MYGILQSKKREKPKKDCDLPKKADEPSTSTAGGVCDRSYNQPSRESTVPQTSRRSSPVMSSVVGARSEEGAPEETNENVCNPCAFEGQKKEATKFCVNCREFFCRDCTESHRKFKITRNHKLCLLTQIPIQSATAETPCLVLCESCQHSEVTDYCEHHNVVICQACKSRKHRKCQTEQTRKKGVSYDERNIKVIVQKIKSLIYKTDRILQERNADLRTLALFKDRCTRDINTFRQELNNFLDLLEKKILKEMNEQESRVRQEIEGHLSICSATKEMLRTDFKLLEDINKSSVKNAKFAAEVRVTNRLNEHETLLQDIDQESITPILSFTKNDQLMDMKKKIVDLGTLTVNYSRDCTARCKSFLDLNIRSSSKVSRGLEWITGLDFLPNGQVIVCDHYHGVELLDSSFVHKASLDKPEKPWDVSVIDDTIAIITLPEAKKLQYIHVEQGLKAGPIIKLDKNCWGVEVVGKEMYITLHNNSGEGEVRILDMTGNVIKSVGINTKDAVQFQSPFYLTTRPASGKIYVSDYKTHTVTCLLSDGTVVYQYTDADLKYPRGIRVDADDNILVCGQESYNVQIVTAAGKKYDTLLSRNDCIYLPFSIAIRHTEDTLVTGGYCCYIGVHTVAQ